MHSGLEIRERRVEYIERIDREGASGNFRHLLVLREPAKWTLQATKASVNHGELPKSA